MEFVAGMVLLGRLGGRLSGRSGTGVLLVMASSCWLRGWGVGVPEGNVWNSWESAQVPGEGADLPVRVLDAGLGFLPGHAPVLGRDAGLSIRSGPGLAVWS